MVLALAGDSTTTRDLATGAPGSRNLRVGDRLDRHIVGSRASDRSPLPFSVVPSPTPWCQTVVMVPRSATVYCAPLCPLSNWLSPHDLIETFGTIGLILVGSSSRDSSRSRCPETRSCSWPGRSARPARTRVTLT